jgi:general secretion pathway protein J
MRAVSSFLRDSLEATVVGRGGVGGLGFGGGLEEGIGETSYFRGEEAGFEWKARLVFGENYGGTFLVRVAREDDQLVLWWQRPPQSTNAIDWTGQPSRVLIPRMQEFEVAYRGPDGGDWQPQWREQERPHLVRLAIKANERYWPELVMAVQ